MRALQVAAAGLVLVLGGGCRKEPPPPIIEVSGIVLLQGAPVYNAEVLFFPQIDHGPQYVAKGVTDKEGRFTLTCNGQSGACADENLVVIKDAPIPAKLQGENVQAELQKYMKSLGARPPPRYGNVVGSPLSALVSETQRTFVFDLEP
jgi:hypothetical protein